jgi:hypothetical protein
VRLDSSGGAADVWVCVMNVACIGLPESVNRT